MGVTERKGDETERDEAFSKLLSREGSIYQKSRAEKEELKLQSEGGRRGFGNCWVVSRSANIVNDNYIIIIISN